MVCKSPAKVEINITKTAFQPPFLALVNVI